MVLNIGLIDYDLIRSKTYITPNYDIGLIYAYLKDDRNYNVRLVSSFSNTNLVQYDKIFIFKNSTYLAHPSSVIKNYYKLPIEEFGPGFIDKPLRPYFLETRYLKPDFKCYNNLLLFSMEHPRHPIAVSIKHSKYTPRYDHIRLYEELDGELLKKDYPQNRYNVIYDDPVDIINEPKRWTEFKSLIDQHKVFLFAHSLDISKINDTNIIEQIFSSSKYRQMRRKLEASTVNDNVKWLVTQYINKRFNFKSNVLVRLAKTENPYADFQTMLDMIYYHHLGEHMIKLIPYNSDFLSLPEQNFARLSYEFLQSKTHLMSFYEYVFNIAYLSMGVPKELIHTGEDRYEYIMSSYGQAKLLVHLEQWISNYPEYEEQIFIGGSSKYEKQRRKYYDLNRSPFAFGRSPTDTSEECGS